MDLRWRSALAWRLDRHALGVPASDPFDVVDRLRAVPASSGDPELAVAIRAARPVSDAVARLVVQGRLLKTFAFGGATYLMTPRHAADLLALRAAGRQWELPSWRSHYGVAPARWPALREIVRAAVAAGPVTRAELARRVTAHTEFAHLTEAFTHRSFTFVKPFAWQGDVCFGPVDNGEATLVSLDTIQGWRGVAPLAEAGPRALLDYLASYGPAPATQLHAWFTDGLTVPRRLVSRWVEALGDRVVWSDVEGTPALARAEDAAVSRATSPDDRIRFLPAYDQWLFGAGTTFAPIVPPSHRALFSRGARPVTVGGRVAGTWQARDGVLHTTWFAEDTVPRARIEDAAQALAGIAGLSGDVEITTSA